MALKNGINGIKMADQAVFFALKFVIKGKDLFMRRHLSLLVIALSFLFQSNIYGQVERIKYGDFNQWVTRELHESKIIGGHNKELYEVGPTQTINGNNPYRPFGGSPWGTSNVYAKVSGVVKGSCAVFPEDDPGNGKCAKLSSLLEQVKVLGLVNMKVMVAGSLFLGQMIEPISSTSNPYSKMDMGMPYTKRPKSLVFDYKVDMPNVDYRIKATGFGSQKKLQGRDEAVVFVFLQRRWEDSEGNLHAKRVATGGKLFKNSSSWNRSYNLPLVYGDASKQSGYGSFLALRSGDNAYYGRNSKGKMVPVIEEGWDSPDATPTHVIVMFSAGNGLPYEGTPGLTLYVDNVGFGF